MAEPGETVAEPPGEAVAEPPKEAMAEAPGGTMAEPPGETWAEPPDGTTEAPSHKEGAVTSYSGVVTAEASSNMFCSGLTFTVGEVGAEVETRTVLRVVAGEAGADWPLFCPDFSGP